MAENQLISTIKYVAATKPAFFLSEIIPYLDKPLPVDQVQHNFTETVRLGTHCYKE